MKPAIHRSMTLVALALAEASLLGCASSGGGGWFRSAQRDEPRITTPAQRAADLAALRGQAQEMDAGEQERIASRLAQDVAAEEDALLRAQMYATLGAFDARSAEEALRAGMRDEDRDCRVACCQAWSERGNVEAIRLLAEALEPDNDRDVRLAAARGLGRIKDPAAVTPLAEALEDPDPAMQHRAVQSLAAVTGQDYGNDVNAWRNYVRGGSPSPPSLAQRIRGWF